ncbi:MAG TPA: hypothetical protein VFQ35_04215 [Polyangiaceae bacterium]|nr:hypothetical protein [Polyangiaceae bacterium]
MIGEGKGSTATESSLPTCFEPSEGGGVRVAPEAALPELAKSAAKAPDSIVNVIAKLAALDEQRGCGPDSDYFWPRQDCAKAKYIELELEAGSRERTRAAAKASWFGGGLEVGREYRWSLQVCAGANPGVRPVAIVLGYEATGRAAGGKPEECKTDAWRAWPERDLRQLSVNEVLPGGFRTKGFVATCFKPQPCPPHALCKPQAAPNALFAADASLKGPFLRVDGACDGRYRVGAGYELAVVLHSRDHLGFVNSGYACAAQALSADATDAPSAKAPETKVADEAAPKNPEQAWVGLSAAEVSRAATGERGGWGPRDVSYSGGPPRVTRRGDMWTLEWVPGGCSDFSSMLTLHFVQGRVRRVEFEPRHRHTGMECALNE